MVTINKATITDRSAIASVNHTTRQEKKNVLIAIRRDPRVGMPSAAIEGGPTKFALEKLVSEGYLKKVTVPRPEGSGRGAPPVAYRLTPKGYSFTQKAWKDIESQGGAVNLAKADVVRPAAAPKSAPKKSGVDESLIEEIVQRVTARMAERAAHAAS